MKIESISPEGLRADGRRPKEHRTMTFKQSIQNADGSCFISHGNTKLLNSVHGPHQHTTQSTALSDRAQLSIDLTSSSFSSKYKRDKKILQYNRNIGLIFNSVVFVDLFPKTEITIQIQVLQVDGSLLSSAINSTTLALIDAGIPMSDYVVASTCGFFNNEYLHDLNHDEESDIPSVVVAMLGRSGKILMVNLEKSVGVDDVEALIEEAVDGCRKVFEEMEQGVAERAQKMAELMD